MRLEEVKQAIRNERIRRGLSQEALADMCGHSAGTIRSIESGDRAVSIPILVGVCTALGLTLDFGVKETCNGA